jgi:GT2 family glycosyltransferase
MFINDCEGFVRTLARSRFGLHMGRDTLISAVEPSCLGVAKRLTNNGIDAGALGLVVIGRNEGDRLRLCLASLTSSQVPIVYVDSGSTDGSVELARTMGAEIVELDPSRPFSQARARNEGFAHLLASHPNTILVQFVDGDCQLGADWLAAGADAMKADPSVAIVTGRLCERNPKESVYHLLCSLEWQQPPGTIKTCGGIFMIRTVMFEKVRGFNALVVSAEDDDLCLRVRAAGGSIVRLDHPMGLHDMGSMTFSRWWKRSLRVGHGYALGSVIHGHSSERYFQRQTRSAWFWGAVVPALTLLAAWPTHGWSLLMLLAYPLLAIRVFLDSRRRRGWTTREAMCFSLFCVLAKFPQALGVIRYGLERIRGLAPGLIEYK